MVTSSLSRRTALLGTLAGSAAASVPAFGAAPQDAPATIQDAVQFELGGEEGREPWRVVLYVPPGEAPAAGWPVLYVLDGNALTATAIDMERVQGPSLGDSGLRSRFAVVGIGYRTTHAYSAQRWWDYTPPPGRTYPPRTPGGQSMRTGGADAFLRFIETTLKPAVARRCPIDRGRQALFGHSFGGLFVLYALAQDPSAFSHWIAASPSIFWEDLAILPSIERLERASAVSARVLVSAGEYEADLAPFQADAPDRDTLRARLAVAQTVTRARDMAARLGRIPGIECGFRLIPGRTHVTVLPEALNDGIAFAFGSGITPRTP